MNRSEFLKILGVTPFAVKSFIKDEVKRSFTPIEKKVSNPKTNQCLLKDKKGNEIAILYDINIELNRNLIEVSGRDRGYNEYIQGLLEWRIDFNNSVSFDYRILEENNRSREILFAEAYYPKEGYRISGDVYIQDLLTTLTRQGEIISGSLKGSGALTKEMIK